MASRSTPVNGVGYDKSLLADAPEITKADKQEGYNPDLLEQGRPSPRPGTVPPPSGTRSPALGPPKKYGGSGSDESSGVRKGALPVTTHTGSKPARSKKLIIAIAAVVLLICIGVGVGVGVGVSKGRGNGNNNGVADPNATSVDTGKPTGTLPTATDSGKPPGGAESTPVSSSSSDEGGGAGGGGGGGSTPTGNLPTLPTDDTRRL